MVGAALLFALAQSVAGLNDVTAATFTCNLAGQAATAAPVAWLVLDGRRLIGGRHWGSFFVGAGLCEVRNVRTGEARR